MITFKACAMFYLPKSLMELAWKLTKCGLLPFSSNPLSNQDDVTYLSFSKLDFEKLKEIRTLAKCRMNTLLSVIVLEAVRRYFEFQNLSI